MSLNLPNVLYHGAAVEFAHIDVTKGRPRKDFGKGFYMAFSREQAIGMMHKKFDEMVGRRADGRILAYSCIPVNKV